VGRLKGLCGREGGSHSLGCTCCEERESVDWNCCEVEPRFWVADYGEWTKKRDRSPCELVASAQGWLLIGRK
jgi:hypothetical protein